VIQACLSYEHLLLLQENNTALHKACEYGHVNVAKVLVRCGANKDCVNMQVSGSIKRSLQLRTLIRA
jgi:ankyrin repeat protein